MNAIKLQRILFNGLRSIQLKRHFIGRPLVLKGDEGIIIRDLMEEIEDQLELRRPDKWWMYPVFGGSPIICEHELPVPPKLNTYHGYIS